MTDQERQAIRDRRQQIQWDYGQARAKGRVVMLKIAWSLAELYAECPHQERDAEGQCVDCGHRREG